MCRCCHAKLPHRKSFGISIVAIYKACEDADPDAFGQGSVIWLLRDLGKGGQARTIVSRRLEGLAKHMGVDPARLIFTDPVEWEEHVRRVSATVPCLGRFSGGFLPPTPRLPANDRSCRSGGASSTLSACRSLPRPLTFVSRAQGGLADLFLDTLSYNAHSTGCNSLWAGVPLLTYSGEKMASRVAAVGAPWPT